MLLPSCLEVRNNLTEYLEGALPWHKRLGFRIHLALCRTCHALQSSLKALPAFGKQVLQAPTHTEPLAKEALAAALQRIKSSKEPKA